MAETEKSLREGRLLDHDTQLLDEGGIKAFASRKGPFIDALFVAPAHQGLGLGKQLLDHLKAQSEALTLSAFAQNPRAIRFYQREGFQATEVKKHHQTGETIVLFRWAGKNGGPCAPSIGKGHPCPATSARS